MMEMKILRLMKNKAGNKDNDPRAFAPERKEEFFFTTTESAQGEREIKKKNTPGTAQ